MGVVRFFILKGESKGFQALHRKPPILHKSHVYRVRDRIHSRELALELHFEAPETRIVHYDALAKKSTQYPRANAQDPQSSNYPFTF